jgi:YhcH/YjgK/YiaL family protein
MIVSNIENSNRIESLHPLFKQLFDYVKSHDMLHTPLGRIDIKGDELFINNNNPECKKREDQVLELHHQYIDIQILLEGCETIGWKAADELNEESVISPYNEKEDYALYNDTPTTFFDIYPRQFVIFYPEDAHAPIIGEGKIRKMVAKVKL